MLNYIWPAFIVIAFIFAIITGNVSNLNQSVFTSLEDVLKLVMTLIGTMSLWCGLMEIVKNTSLINKIVKVLNPLIHFLFPELKNEENTRQDIAMNMVSNMLGLGNAATPMGIKAMQGMQKCNDNKEELSNSMILFIVLNTASIQIIPTTVLAIRSSLESKDPTKVIIPILVSSFVAAVTGITLTKALIKMNKRRRKAIWKS